MILNKIYKQVYSEMEDQTTQDDYAISDKLEILMEEIEIGEIDKEKLEILLCKASLIGQEQGFISGWRAAFRLLKESF